MTTKEHQNTQDTLPSAMTRTLTTAFGVGVIAAATTLAVDENPSHRQLAKAFLYASACIATSLSMVRPAQALLNRSANKPLDP